MRNFELSMSSAIGSMSRKNVSWSSESSYECEPEIQTEQDRLVEEATYSTGKSSYLEYVAKVIGFYRDYSPAIKIPKIATNRRSVIRTNRATRPARPAARQTFAARKSAKSADGGGGSSDPDGRRAHIKTNTINTCNTFSAVSAFLFGGAK